MRFTGFLDLYQPRHAVLAGGESMPLGGFLDDVDDLFLCHGGAPLSLLLLRSYHLSVYISTDMLPIWKTIKNLSFRKGVRLWDKC